MTRAELRKLEHALRALRGSVTSLGEVLQTRPRRADQLHLERHKLKASASALEVLLAAERAALLEPHAFIPPRWPAPLDKWCVRCGGTRDRQELHPPELQESNNGAARAAGGS